MARENLLIIGLTTSGKSALANVICGTKVFDESERTVRNSRDFQEYDFVWDGTKYHVVDIRVKLIEREILYKIGQVIYSMPEGISQVLFVTDQRLTAEEREKLKEIESDILKIDIVKYTTIVRTKFKDFKSKDECKKDKKDLRSLNKKIFNKFHISFNSPRLHIVHVDNPPTHIYVGDSDDDDTVKNNSRRRERSRTILLEHLKKVCSKKYKLNMWDKLDRSNRLELEDLAMLVRSHLESNDPAVASIIRKLKTGNN
jgi:hypothetical protein